MKFEQDLVGGAARHIAGNVVSMLTLKKRRETTEARRLVRTTTDALIHEAVNLNTLPPLLMHSAEVMLTLAEQLNAHMLDPDVPHFIEAARALIEDARTIFDAGMRVDDTEKAMVGAVMIEIAIRGIFHTLGQDYELALGQRFISEERSNGRIETTAASRGPGENLGDPDDRPPDRAA